MLNKKLEKQIQTYNSKCWECYFKMQHSFDVLKSEKLQREYDKYQLKFNETKRLIESDGKHKVMFNNKQLIIKEIQINAN